MKWPVTYRRKICFSGTDAQGIVFNGNYATVKSGRGRQRPILCRYNSAAYDRYAPVSSPARSRPVALKKTSGAPLAPSLPGELRGGA